jgi:hypothetical protein
MTSNEELEYLESNHDLHSALGLDKSTFMARNYLHNMHNIRPKYAYSKCCTAVILA